MARQSQRHQQMRAKIMAAALKLFSQRGFKKTSVSEIATEASVSPVTLYKYFESKTALGHAVVLKLTIDGYQQYQQLVDDSKLSFKELLVQMLSSSQKLAQGINASFYDFIVADMRGEFGTQETMLAYQTGKVDFWKSFIQRGKTVGEINPAISDQALLLYLDMYVQYFQNPNNAAMYRDHPEMMQQMTGELETLFFYGFLGQPAPQTTDSQK